jgi:hypothetical protein
VVDIVLELKVLEIFGCAKTQGVILQATFCLIGKRGIAYIYYSFLFFFPFSEEEDKNSFCGCV